MVFTRIVKQRLCLKAAFCGLLIAMAVQLTGCSRPSTLETVKSEGVLHVITRNAPSIYYEDRDGPTGFDYELAQRFAEHLGVELRVRLVAGNEDILPVLDRGHAHIGFTGLAISDAWSDRFRAMANGLTSQSIIIYNREQPHPSDLSSLVDKGVTVHLAGDSNHIHNLQALAEQVTLPAHKVHPGLDAAGIMERVEAGEFLAAVVDANELALNHVYFPNVKQAFSISEPEDIAWLFPASHDDTLFHEAESFLASIREDGTLAQLRERFYGHLDRLNYVGSLTFDQHVRERLPDFRSHFQHYGQEFGVDWRLLAAIGYQESNWRPDAVSPTGVRGLMMLTLNTARYIGVDNRLDPVESIAGGARYFRRVHSRIPDRIPEPDRTWFALASYNVGTGHLEDARRLTQGGGKNPDRWMDVKEFLPLLSQKEWYSKTRFGYARGNEPVAYVQNIRRYYDVLTRMYEPASDLPTTVSLTDQEPAQQTEIAEPTPPTEMTLVLPKEMGMLPPTL